jgi:MFS transporter, NNP family, nitrate/nitrite transporter
MNHGRFQKKVYTFAGEMSIPVFGGILSKSIEIFFQKWEKRPGPGARKTLTGEDFDITPMAHHQSSRNSGENADVPGPLASRLGPLLFMTGIFFLICLARGILSPLMPAIKEELGLGHDDAGTLFFLMTIGHSSMVLASGFVSSLLNHRRTILLASFALGGALLTVALNPGLRGIQLGLLLAGLASGLYIPSGIATLTSLVRPGDWGKAIALHELAPNLSFVAAPLLTEALLNFMSWRGVLILLGVASFVSGLIYIRFGKGGSFPGEAPRAKTLRILLAEPSFWLMVILFSLGIGASSGLYSMMPLFLIAAKGMDRGWANTLMGLSRIPTLFTSFVAGWATDRFGLKVTLIGVFLFSGVTTILIGVTSGDGLTLFIFLEAIVAAAFFPAGFAALSRIGSSQIKNVLVSLTVPLGFIIGAGAIPAFIGIMGEAGSFPLGMTVAGVVFLGGVILSGCLRFKRD